MTDHRQDNSPRDGRPPNGWFRYWPLAPSFLLWMVLIGLLAIVFVSVAGYAYERIGLSPGWFYAILAGSILGSQINIPIARFPDRRQVERIDVIAFGVRYQLPVVRHSGTTVLAVNVGGAIVPTGLAAYFTVADGVWLHALIGTAVVTVLARIIARPVQGVGIVAPPLVPPAVAAVSAILIGGHSVAALAYISGTVGTLTGADLLNLRRIRDLGAPVASIGGAGTFDGIFLTGILAVVLAAL